MTSKAQALAKQYADAILKAAGSGFQHYMPSTKERITAVAQEQLDAVSGPLVGALGELMYLNENMPICPGEIFQDRIDNAWYKARTALAAHRERMGG